MTLRPSAHRFARPLLFAVGLGALAEILFDGPALGVGVVVFVAGLLLAAVVIRPPDAALDRADVWLGPVALVFAAFIGLRADPTLILFDLIVTLLLATGAAIALSGTAVTRAALDRLVRLSGWATAVVLVGCAHLVDAARPWAGVPTLSPERSRTGGALVRGVILAAVPVLVFIGLFTAADSVFARAIDDVTRVSVDLGELPGHLAYVVVTGWLVAGYLAIVAFGAVADSPRGRALVTWSSVFFGTAETVNPDLADRPGSQIDQSAPVDEPPVAWGVVPAGSARPSLGWAEATVVLVAIDLVFAAFVAIQVAYLFGGLDTLAASGQTYSEYATRGFHELVAVAILAGAIILSLEALVVDRRPRIYVAAATGLLILTAVVLTSAFLRLRLYQDAYGWTELRFYVFTAIVGLGLSIGLVVVLLIRDQSRWAIHGLGLIVLFVAVGVNLVGPHAFVAGQNVARAADPTLVPPGGKSGLDARYVLGLSDDAVPTLVDALSRIPEPDRSTIADGLRRRAAEVAADPSLDSPAAWNLARSQARAALEAVPPR